MAERLLSRNECLQVAGMALVHTVQRQTNLLIELAAELGEAGARDLLARAEVRTKQDFDLTELGAPPTNAEAVEFNMARSVSRAIQILREGEPPTADALVGIFNAYAESVTVILLETEADVDAAVVQIVEAVKGGGEHDA